MKRRATVLMAMLLCAVSLVACGKDKETDSSPQGEISVSDTTNDTTEAEKEQEEAEDAPEGMYYSELTHELISEDLKDQRPIAAMVDNESIALPHYGLSQADVVYEMMNSTENGRITRLMVLVKDWENIEQLGSIRSVRPTNVILAAEWNAILCHDGGPFYIDEYLAEPCSDNFSGGFSRVNNGKSREYTEYILSGDLDKKFSGSDVSQTYNQYYEGAHFKFAHGDDVIDLSQFSGAEAAITVKLPFPHNGSYLAYDSDAQVYKYFEYGKAHTDPGNNNEQLSFKNLLIQNCDFEQLDENGYMIYDCIGTNSGYYITNGEAIKITWKKTAMASPTKYYDENGDEIRLNTGKTYIALVPSDKWSDLVIE